jgi:serine/threonine protein kinase
MERLADRYQLGDALGQGRSTVYRAVDTRLRRDVAIKRVQLLAGQEDAEQVRTRALREAQASARLNNPSAVTVYDVVEEDGAIWLVMELVDGPSLSEVVADEGPLPPARAARIGLAVLTALEAAHLVGVVHRDVKPANVLIAAGDRPKLTDFGVATIRDESRVTATGLIVGSPSYMSPEQATGGEITPATDLWALGALLYFAVEGVPPFQAGNALATASAVVHGQPRPQENPGPLSPLLDRLFTKDPSGRPSAGEVRVTLARVARSDRARRRAQPIPPAEPTLVATAALSPEAPATPAPAPPPEPEPEPEPELPPAEPEPDPEPTAGTETPSGDSTAVHPLPSPERPAPSPRAPREPAEPAGPSRVFVLVAAAIVLLVIGGAVAALGGGDDDDGGETADEPATQTTEAEADASPDPPTTVPDATTTTEEPTTTTTEGSGLPADWAPYSDPQGGYSIGVPPGWQVSPTGNARRVDFRDPATGAFLRVEWTDQPGPDVAADWRNQATNFAAGNANYDEIGIAPVEYRDYDAALWEFRHGSGETLHTGNLGLVTNGKGFALMFRTPESQWQALQPVFEQFKQAFQPT